MTFLGAFQTFYHCMEGVYAISNWLAYLSFYLFLSSLLSWCFMCNLREFLFHKFLQCWFSWLSSSLALHKVWKLLIYFCLHGLVSFPVHVWSLHVSLWLEFKMQQLLIFTSVMWALGGVYIEDLCTDSIVSIFWLCHLLMSLCSFYYSST